MSYEKIMAVPITCDRWNYSSASNEARTDKCKVACICKKTGRTEKNCIYFRIDSSIIIICTRNWVSESNVNLVFCMSANAE